MKVKLILATGLFATALATAVADKPMSRHPKNTDPALKQTFEAVCPCGRTSQSKPVARHVHMSYAARNEHGVHGNIIEKTMTFKCPTCKCTFNQQAETEFVPLKPKAKQVAKTP